MSMRLLLTTAHEHELKVMRDDTCNAFPNAPTNEKVHVVAGEEFGEGQGNMLEIIKSLCRMSTSSR